MNSFLTQIVTAAGWIKANWPQILAAWAALIAAASGFVRALQAVVDCFERLWPGISKADSAFGRVLSFLAWLSHVKLFNILALTPQPEHAAAAYKRPGDVTTEQKLTSTIVSDATASGKLALLFVGLVLTSSSLSCTHASPVEQQLINCATSAVQQQLPGLLTQVTGILQSGSVNWQSSLDALLATAGDAVVCAVQQVVSDLEHHSDGGVGAAQANVVVIARGEAWLTSHSK